MWNLYENTLYSVLSNVKQVLFFSKFSLPKLSLCFKFFFVKQNVHVYMCVFSVYQLSKLFEEVYSICHDYIDVVYMYTCVHTPQCLVV